MSSNISINISIPLLQGTPNSIMSREWFVAFSKLVDFANANGGSVSSQNSFLFQTTVLGASAAPLFTVPSSSSNTFLSNAVVSISNPQGAPISVQLYVVQNGQSIDATSQFFNAEIQPNAVPILVNVPQISVGGILYGAANGPANISPISGYLQS